MKQTAAFHGGYIEVGRFSNRYEATARQTGYISSLCKQLGMTVETAHERLFGMPCIHAYSDRPWMRLTKNEASKLIDRLLKSKAAQEHADRVQQQEDARESYKNALADHNEFEQEPDSRRIECPF